MSGHLVQLLDGCQAKCEFPPANVNATHPKTAPPCAHPAANYPTSILFHLALDRRLNKLRNILLMMFFRTPPHSSSPLIRVGSKSGTKFLLSPSPPAPSVQGVPDPA